MTTGNTQSVHTAVCMAIRAARDGDRIKPWHEPYAALVSKIARQASAKDISPADLARAATRIEALLSKLPLSDEGTPDDRAPDPGVGAGEVGSRPVGLESPVGSGPEMGDTALPR